MKNLTSIFVMIALGLTLSACNRTPVQDGVAVDDANMSDGSGGASATGLGADGSATGSGIGWGTSYMRRRSPLIPISRSIAAPMPQASIPARGKLRILSEFVRLESRQRAHLTPMSSGRSKTDSARTRSLCPFDFRYDTSRRTTIPGHHVST